MKRSAVSNPAPRRRGMVVALVAVSMVTLLLFGSLAVDVGYICALCAEMQGTADAGSLAGASALHEGKYSSVDHRAFDVIARNQEFQGFRSLKDQIIEVGRWDRATATFSALDPDSANKGNAVRVVSVRNDAPLFFAAIIGRLSTDVSRQAVAMVAPTCGGVWGLDDVFVPGNVMVDSYDSTEGDYSAGSAGDNGDVCSNGELRVAGSIEINGDTLGSPVTVSGGKAVINGYIDTLDQPVEIPPVDFGDVATNNDNATIGLTDNGFDPLAGGTLNIPANDNLTLAEGKYYFDNVEFGRVKGKKIPGSITVTGPVEIYITGGFGVTAQGTINTTKNPHDFKLISSGPRVDIVGGASFYGSIFAPNADVLLAGNADMFGALIGRSVKMAGSFEFHVDESLPVVHSLKRPPLLVR